jgi:hypothetical protein
MAQLIAKERLIKLLEDEKYNESKTRNQLFSEDKH